MKEKIVDSIIEARKNYLANQSKGELIVLIKEYSKLGLFEEVCRYIRKFLDESGDIYDLAMISESFPGEVKDFLNLVKAQNKINEDFDADSLLEMGELLWEIGSPEEARENYMKAFNSYIILGKVDSAEEVLNTLKEKYPDDREISEVKMKDIKGELLSKLSKLEEIKPQDEVDLRYALGRKMHEDDLLADAEENYKKILNLKDNHKARRYLVALLKDRNALDEAMSYAEKFPLNDRVDEYYALAESFMENGNKTKANNLLREIYEIDSEYKDVKELLEKGEREEEAFVGIQKEVIRTVEESTDDGKEYMREGKIVFL